MKERELREIATCSGCGRGLAHAGNPDFYVIEARQMIFDAGALTRRHGLDLMIGNPRIAQVFSPDEDLAHELPPVRLGFCQPCALKPTSVMELALHPTREEKVPK